MIERIWFAVCDRAFMALRRATSSMRIDSTEPSAVFATPSAWPDCTARAAEIASVVSDLPCRRRSWRLPRHLDHRDLLGGQEPGQAGTPGAGAFDPDRDDVAEPVEPAPQRGVARCGCGERLGAEHPAELVECGCDVGVFVGVDAHGHRTCSFLRWSSPSLPLYGFKGLARTCREGAGNPGTVGADPEPVPHPTGECRLRAGRRIVRSTTVGVSRFVSQTNPETKPTDSASFSGTARLRSRLPQFGLTQRAHAGALPLTVGRLRLGAQATCTGG